METRQDTARILRKAADIMIAGGYVKGRRHGAHGEHCALGAIDEATRSYDSFINTPAVIALSNMLPEVVGPDPYNFHENEPKRDNHISRVATWSNNLCDSAEQVACVMRAAAEFVELQETTHEE